MLKRKWKNFGAKKNHAEKSKMFPTSNYLEEKSATLEIIPSHKSIHASRRMTGFPDPQRSS